MEVYLEGAIRKIDDLAARTAILTHLSARDDGSGTFASRKIKTIRGSFTNRQCLCFATDSGLVFGNSEMFIAWIELYRNVADTDLWEVRCPATMLPVSRLL